MITLLSTFVATDEASAAQMAALLSDMSEAVRSEPGHVTYGAFRVREDPTVIYVQETWASQADADAHLNRAAPAAAKATGLLAGSIETVTLVAIEARAANRTNPRQGASTIGREETAP